MRAPLRDRIEEADVVGELRKAVRRQIRQQASAALYAQANSSLKSVLSFF
ncbi:MAG: flagellin [Bacteroidota bacterium]